MMAETVATGGPAVSVVINCLNGERYLREAIESVYAQTVADWEIVFWDNASSDGSASIARGFDDRLRYFRSDATIPLYAARNRAVEQARGPVIGFLDADDAWMPTKLERQLPLFATSARVGLVYSNLEITGETGGTRRWYHTRQASGDIFAELLRHYHLMLPSVLVARRALGAARPFDETMMVAGDADLFLRICHDWDAVYCPELTARYREHEDSLTSRRPDLFLSEGDRLIDRLSNLYPGFLSQYAAELVAFRATRLRAHVFSAWSAGRGPRARALAMAHLKSGGSLAVLWLLSFIPYRWARLLRQTAVYAWWRRLAGR